MSTRTPPRAVPAASATTGPPWARPIVAMEGPPSRRGWASQSSPSVTPNTWAALKVRVRPGAAVSTASGVRPSWVSRPTRKALVDAPLSTPSVLPHGAAGRSGGPARRSCRGDAAMTGRALGGARSPIRDRAAPRRAGRPLMREKHDVGPTVADLRPVRPPNPTFPVYADLAGLLSDPDPGLEPGADPVPHVLSVAAAYSYADDAGTLATLMTRMGLEQCTCSVISERVDALVIDAHAAVIQSRDGSVVLVAFRGTPPMGAISWLIDFDTGPQNIVLSSVQDGAGAEGGAQVHAGFYRNV